MQRPEEVDEYRIVRPLGREPSGNTFLAHDRYLNRAVVLRLVEPGDPRGRLAGAAALARVSHPSLQRVLRVSAQSCPPYIVSEYVRGTRLDALIELPQPAQARAMAVSLAGALDRS